MGIVGVGAVFVDIKGYPFDTYIPAGRNAGRVEQIHGGVMRNVIEDIANIELRPAFVSLVDETGIGQDVIVQLERHKVDTSYMRAVRDGMGTWLAVFNDGGDVVASISKRPDLTPICDILDECGDEIFKNCDSVALEFDIEHEIVKKVISLAEKYNKPLFAVIANMSIGFDRRDLLRQMDCFVCNQQEAGILFSDDYDNKTPEEMEEILAKKVVSANLKRMVVTLGEKGSVYADNSGDHGYVPARKVTVKDTTGAGDAMFAGISAGLTYGKTLRESCEIGTRLAAAVIGSYDAVCPRFLPGEFDLDAPIPEDLDD